MDKEILHNYTNEDEAKFDKIFDIPYEKKTIPQKLSAKQKIELNRERIMNIRPLEEKKYREANLPNTKELKKTKETIVEILNFQDKHDLQEEIEYPKSKLDKKIGAANEIDLELIKISNFIKEKQKEIKKRKVIIEAINSFLNDKTIEIKETDTEQLSDIKTIQNNEIEKIKQKIKELTILGEKVSKRTITNKIDKKIVEEIESIIK